MAELLLPALKRRFSGTKLADPLESLIGLSIARYLADPDRWKPDRAPLLAYLYRDVGGDVLNERDSRARLRRHEEPTSAAVEVAGVDRNLNVEEEVRDEMEPFDVAPTVLARARDEMAAFSDQDRHLIELLGGGVRATSASGGNADQSRSSGRERTDIASAASATLRVSGPATRPGT